jgi:hypothetical protein
LEPLSVSEQEIKLLAEAREIERQARDVLSGSLELQLKALFPTAPADFIKSNGHFSNELARGAGEIADAISAASINWTGPVEDSGIEREFDKELVRLMAVDALVSGKMALFPRVDEQGKFALEALTGYLHPILDPTNALKVAALLQVLAVTDGDRQLFEVRAYRPGLLQVYPAVETLADFAKGTPADYAQDHARDRLPVAFKVLRRDAHRRPLGLVSECLSAFRRYAKTAINRNAVQEIAGWPERVLKSDQYLSHILNGDPLRAGHEHPAVSELKKVAPRQLKVIGSGDSYDVEDGVDPAPHIAAETIDKQALLDLLRSPDLSGGNLTGVALAERQSKSRALISDMCDAIAELVTEACTISEGLRAANIGTGINASLTPRWVVDRNARVMELTGLYQAGALPKSVMLLELQSLGYTSITDEMIDRQQQLELGDAEPNLNDPLPA